MPSATARSTALLSLSPVTVQLSFPLQIAGAHLGRGLVSLELFSRLHHDPQHDRDDDDRYRTAGAALRAGQGCSTCTRWTTPPSGLATDRHLEPSTLLPTLIERRASAHRALASVSARLRTPPPPRHHRCRGCPSARVTPLPSRPLVRAPCGGFPSGRRARLSFFSGWKDYTREGEPRPPPPEGCRAELAGRSGAPDQAGEGHDENIASTHGGIVGRSTEDCREVAPAALPRGRLYARGRDHHRRHHSSSAATGMLRGLLWTSVYADPRALARLPYPPPPAASFDNSWRD